MNQQPPRFRRPQLIISGGQTGVDRAALDAANALGITHGGWCPAGRRAEDGRIPEHYRLRETDSPDYAVRTRRNVDDADATLIISPPPLSGGTALTHDYAVQVGRSCLVIDPEDTSAVAKARAWLAQLPAASSGDYTLNIAGPRESQVPGIGDAARRLVLAILE
jgi:hypothetical protein